MTTTPKPTQPASVSPGQIQFLDAIRPPLVGGIDYRLTAIQEVQNIPSTTVPPYRKVQELRVEVPPFQIDPKLLHQEYPPGKQKGAYFGVVPHLVLSSFSLPWARNPVYGEGDTQSSPPWMILLTVYDAEKGHLSAPVSVPTSDITQKTTGVVLPDIPTIPVSPEKDPAKIPRARIMEMDLDFFQAIAPSKAELPYLGHARVVNTDGKVVLGMDEDGCFSVLVSNRVTNPSGGKHQVYLVSVEGHVDHLHGATIPGDPQRIRLVVLANWEFEALESPGSFLSLMERMRCPGFGGVDLLRMAAPAATTDQTARDALEIGYAPLQNDMRAGETTTSWYRGPFVSSPTRQEQTYAPYFFSDHAVHYDPQTGLFDMSYASAWQLGRLLALSDGAFARSMSAWRRRLHQAAIEARERRDGAQRVAAALGEDASVRGDVQADAKGFIRARFLGEGARPVPQVMSRRRRSAGEHAPGMLDDDELDALETSGEEPLEALRRRIHGDDDR